MSGLNSSRPVCMRCPLHPVNLIRSLLRRVTAYARRGKIGTETHRHAEARRWAGGWFFYPITGWWTKLHAKYFLRPITRKMDNQQLYKRSTGMPIPLIRTYRFFSGIGLGRIANRFIPVCDIDGTLPKNLAPDKLREMVVLDTFDMFSPEYDQPKESRSS